MHNNQPASINSTRPQQFQPNGPVGQKKNRKLLLVAGISLFVLGALVALGFFVSNLLGDSESRTSGINGRLSISEFSQGVFIDNAYTEGARPMQIEGEVKALGVSEDGSRLTLWRQGSSDSPSELVVYDTASLSQVASAPMDECVLWRRGESVLCATTQGSSSPALAAYSIKDAAQISEKPLFVHPQVSERADASALRDLEIAGVMDGLTILSVNASNSYLDASAMTEAEMSRAKNLMGVYAVDNNMVVAVRDNGEVAWKHEMSTESSCGLVMGGKIVACLNSDAGEGQSQASIVALDASDGSVTGQRTTSKKVIMASDGWIESDDAMSSEGSGLSFSELMKGAPLAIYGFDGRKKDDTTLPAGLMLGSMVPAPEWSVDQKITYTVKDLLNVKGAEIAVDSDGNIIASQQIGSDGITRVVNSRTGKSVAEGSLMCVSRDGGVLFTLYQDVNNLSAKPLGSLVSTDRGEKVSQLSQGDPLLARCINGIIVVDDLGDMSDYSTIKPTTIIYVPGR